MKVIIVGGFASVLKGQTVQPSETVDGHFTNDVR